MQLPTILFDEIDTGVRQPLPVQEGILNECFSIRRVCKYFLRKCRNLS